MKNQTLLNDRLDGILPGAVGEILLIANTTVLLFGYMLRGDHAE